MSQYRDYEQQMMSAQRPNKITFVSCRKCNCEWLEQFQVSKFDSNVSVAPNMQLPDAHHAFTFLRCVKCGDVQEIATSTSGWDRPSQDAYTKLLDDLAAPLEDKKPEEKK